MYFVRCGAGLAGSRRAVYRVQDIYGGADVVREGEKPPAHMGQATRSAHASVVVLVRLTARVFSLRAGDVREFVTEK